MLSRCQRIARRVRPATADDGGFTIVEIIVAITIVVIVMTAMAAFMVSSANATDGNTLRQVGIELASDGQEQARSLDGVGAVSGRDKTSSDTLWNQGLNTTSSTLFPGVAPYLANVSEAYDTSNPANVNGQPAGYTAPLPTDGNVQTIDGVAFTQNWFIGNCYASTTVTSQNVTCASTGLVTTVQYYQVVVAVTWKSSRYCRTNTNNICSYVSSTLISPTPDPLFDANASAPKPKITNPGDQTSSIGQPIAPLVVTMSGGTAPLTWTSTDANGVATGLPPGLTGTPVSTPSTFVIRGTPTAGGSYVIILKVTDAFGFVSTARFTWTVKAAPNLANPGPQVWAVGANRTLALSTMGGTSPYTYAATNLPTGVTLNPSTGVLTENSLAVSSTIVNVTYRVTDAAGLTDVKTATFQIVDRLSLDGIANEGTDIGNFDNRMLTANGGDGSYTWAVRGLDTTWMMGSANAGTYTISGTPASAAAPTSTISVILADGSGNTTTGTFTWTVYSALSLTAPTGPLSTAVGAGTSATAVASGGGGGYTYSATNLPAGLRLNSGTGAITGSVTSGYKYLTTIAVTDGTGASASKTFVWTSSGDVAITLSGSDPRSSNVGAAIGGTFSASGGCPNSCSKYTWTSSNLPPGVSLNQNTGVLSGSPTTAGTYLVTVTAQAYYTRLFGLVTVTGSSGIYQFVWTVN